jgi:hypothetical protein
VVEILDATRLLGRCLNSHKLGQRKNCNLPGVLLDLPVLGPKDVQDVQGFAAKHGMDYIFASFVQSADDVRYIRKVKIGLVRCQSWTQLCWFPASCQWHDGVEEDTVCLLCMHYCHHRPLNHHTV